MYPAAQSALRRPLTRSFGLSSAPRIYERVGGLSIQSVIEKGNGPSGPLTCPVSHTGSVDLRCIAHFRRIWETSEIILYIVHQFLECSQGKDDQRPGLSEERGELGLQYSNRSKRIAQSGPKHFLYTYSFISAGHGAQVYGMCRSK